MPSRSWTANGWKWPAPLQPKCELHLARHWDTAWREVIVLAGSATILYSVAVAVAGQATARPGASFVINGAAQAHDAALVTTSAEMKWLNCWSTVSGNVVGDAGSDVVLASVFTQYVTPSDYRVLARTEDGFVERDGDREDEVLRLALGGGLR